MNTWRARRARRQAERVILYRRMTREWADDIYRASCYSIIRAYGGADFTKRIADPMFRQKRKDLYRELTDTYGEDVTSTAVDLVEDHDWDGFLRSITPEEDRP